MVDLESSPSLSLRLTPDSVSDTISENGAATSSNSADPEGSRKPSASSSPMMISDDEEISPSAPTKPKSSKADLVRGTVLKNGAATSSESADPDDSKKPSASSSPMIISDDEKISPSAPTKPSSSKVRDKIMENGAATSSESADPEDSKKPSASSSSLIISDDEEISPSAPTTPKSSKVRDKILEIGGGPEDSKKPSASSSSMIISDDEEISPSTPTKPQSSKADSVSDTILENSVATSSKSADPEGSRKPSASSSPMMISDDEKISPSAPTKPSSSKGSKRAKKVKGVIKIEKDIKEEAEVVGDNGEPSNSKKRKSLPSSESADESSTPTRRLRTRIQPDKRFKFEDETSPKEEYNLMKRKSIKAAKRGKNEKYERCKICRQILSSPDLRLFQGHPHNAVEESVALVDPKLVESYNESDIPLNKLTHFTVYDSNGHLCPLDGEILERNQTMLISGYMKAVFDDDSTPDGGIPVKEVGPITEWWIGGYDGGAKALVGISTDSAEYYLMDPSPEYAPLMVVLLEKIYLGKLVIEFLTKEETATFDDLLNHIQTTVRPPGIPKITEDSLFRHAQFVCDQVVSYDDAGYSDDEEEGGDDDDWRKLIATPCMCSLIELAGATFTKGKKNSRQVKVPRKRRQNKDAESKEKDGWSKATTTPLVSDIFETFFANQLDTVDAKIKGHKKLRCGVCEPCQRADCGTCSSCRDMVKFGGLGKNKQSCINRKCPNMTVKDEIADASDEEEIPQIRDAKPKKIQGFVSTKKKTSWVGEPIHVDDDRQKTYYRSAKVHDEEVTVGDFVSVEAREMNSPVVIGKIQFMWENAHGKKYMHVLLFYRGCETILGESADPQELYMVHQCEATLLNGIMSKVTVYRKEISSNWKNEGGAELAENIDPNDDRAFYFSKLYHVEHGRFEDIPPEFETPAVKPDYKYCYGCRAEAQKVLYSVPQVSDPLEKTSNGKTAYALLRWQGETYCRGQCVYLEPDTFKFGPRKKTAKCSKKDDDYMDGVDEDVYTEIYRKSLVKARASNETTPDPFCIGLISEIVSKQDGPSDAKDITVVVYKFYRPENTQGIIADVNQHDLTKLYGSEETASVSFDRVYGKCYVAYSENIADGDATQWSCSGPDRFYFSDSYDRNERKTVEPSRFLKNLGNAGKGKGKGKGAGLKNKVTIPSHPDISRPLRCLDVFAGCGGLSEGLHQSQVAESKWAIEKVDTAAAAFKLNNRDCTVFTEDCNNFLKSVMAGEKANSRGQKFPQKGDVELLVGGPPCQGFSGMNRFNSREYSLFKNSLIVSYLAFCDYYRPRYFILENVRNFVSFKRSMVLKLTLRCLLKMGYQVAVGILQAGHYGVPQTRRRAIIIAAAPGEVLPQYPEPRHVFSPKTGGLTIVVDDKKIDNGCKFTESAPLRSITVYDALSDLPEIKNGSQKEEMDYGSEAITHFQKMVRDKIEGAKLNDHIVKDMSSLVAARMAHVPKTKNADWRDLPNIVVKLEDGTLTSKLMYTHHDKKNGKSSTGALRGVCSCASDNKCDPMDRQFNTLIPWCLPHTGNRHNHWAGLYGRLQWSEFFSTTVTNPEPMGKQGRVLHPSQNRVVSVRECARSQGFPDKFKFYGHILDKHRQVGNAVPPPMGKAIGMEIRKSVFKKENPLDETEHKSIGLKPVILLKREAC